MLLCGAVFYNEQKISKPRFSEGSVKLYVSPEFKNGIEVSVACILIKILKTVPFKAMVSSVNIVLSRQLFLV